MAASRFLMAVVPIWFSSWPFMARKAEPAKVGWGRDYYYYDYYFCKKNKTKNNKTEKNKEMHSPLTLDDRDIVTGEIVGAEQLAHLHLDQLDQLLIGNLRGKREKGDDIG